MKYKLIVTTPVLFEIEASNKDEAIKKCLKSLVDEKVVNQINPVEIKIVEEIE